MMKLHVVPSSDAVAWVVADIVERFVMSGEPAVLGVATGETMKMPFAEIVRRHCAGAFSLAHVKVFLLDEYVGLEPSSPSSFRGFVDQRLVRPTDLPPQSVCSPDPQASDLQAECARYEREVRRAEVGLQLLGVGANGHIAFNEPGSALDSVTRVVQLSAQTREDNADAFVQGEPVPRAAITQGVATILAAKALVLVACGSAKACALAQALHGPVEESVPASALQRHPDVTVVADEEAASLLNAAKNRTQPSRTSKHDQKGNQSC